MKILPQFFQNPLNKNKIKSRPIRNLNILIGLLLFILLAGIPLKADSQNLQNSQKKETIFIPGILETTRFLSEMEKSIYDKTRESLKSNITNLKDISSYQNLKINTLFFQHLLFYTENKYLYKKIENTCEALNFISSGIFKGRNGKIQNIAIDFTDKNKKNISSLVTLEELLNYYYPNFCPQFNKIRNKFKKLNKKLVSKLNFSLPDKKNTCQSIHYNWVQDIKTPHLCGLYEKFQEIPKIEEILKFNIDDKRAKKKLVKKYRELKRERSLFSYFEISYLRNICENLRSEEKFCNIYESKNFWTQVSYGLNHHASLQYYCPYPLNTPEEMKENTQKCIDLINSKKWVCSQKRNRNFKTLSANHYSYYPTPNCRKLSQSLLKQKIYPEYTDCPEKVLNEDILTIFWLINYFSHPSKNTKEVKKYCPNSIANTFAKFSLKNNIKKSWDVKICYTPNLTNEEICFDSLNGLYPFSDLSEDKIITKILREIRGMGAKQSCTILSKKKYRPYLLKYRAGCYIVYDSKKCNILSCPKKIFFNGVKINGIRKKESSFFSMFSHSIRQKEKEFFESLKKKFTLSTSKVFNLTDIKYALTKNKKAIILGQGCIEDLLPELLDKKLLNQCSPVNFIIDGYFHNKKTKERILVTRIPTHSIHSPVQISWGRLYNAVKNNTSIHPLESWHLYVLEK